MMTRAKANLTDAHQAQQDTVNSQSLRTMDTLHLVHKLVNKLQAPFSTYLQDQYSIGFNEFRLLIIIGQFPNSASHELAELTGVTPMSVSRAVTMLQKHGRIRAERDANNGRRKVLQLTPEGERLFAAMLPATDLVAQYLLSNLKSDEILAFNRTLNRLIQTLEATDKRGNSLFLEATRPEGAQAGD